MEEEDRMEEAHAHKQLYDAHVARFCVYLELRACEVPLPQVEGRLFVIASQRSGLRTQPQPDLALLATLYIISRWILRTVHTSQHSRRQRSGCSPGDP